MVRKKKKNKKKKKLFSSKCDLSVPILGVERGITQYIEVIPEVAEV